MRVRVSIVDDDEPISRSLKELLQASENIQYISAYNNSAVALKRLPKDNPDIVLMDINLPGINGIECVRQLKEEMPGTQFLMLTVYGDSDHIFDALAAGATGYLLKGADRVQLLDAIRQIVDGGSPMSCAIARKVVQSFSKNKTSGERLETLSQRQRDVLELLAKGYLYKEIADALGLSLMTVDTYVRRIYEKLQVNSRSKAIAKYYGKND
ncbi:MAG: response regulator transcription factor [Nibricoccus sp.]